MATPLDVAERPATGGTRSAGNLVEMNWDPITRIVGSLGIYTKIDFENRRVAECHSTSAIFRGYSIFMKGKDPRDSHFITSRICGICGDNHATCSVYAQNMAYGIKSPPIAEWIINLGEAAEYMFDHNIFQDNLVGVDFCEQMVRQTNPSLWDEAQNTPAPHAADHGYRTIGDIMTALNPFTGDFYRETLLVSRYTREMFSLMEGRHVHPSTLYPGGVGTVPSVQLFTEYMTRLLRHVEFMKKSLPLHDDLFDFFYQALPGYEEVGKRRILLGCWGAYQDPDVCDYQYRTMTNWGRAMYVTPGVVVDGKLVTTDLVDINLQMRILLGHSYYDGWENQEIFVRRDPRSATASTRNIRGTRRRSRVRRNAISPAIIPGSCRRAGSTSVPATILRSTPAAGRSPGLWSTALAGLVDIGYIKATGNSVKIYLPKTALKPEVEFEWKVPQWSNTIERDRARTYFQAYSAAAALYFLERAFAEVQAGRTKTWTEFKVPDEAIGCGFHEAVRGVLSHHLVIRNGKIANYHPYPPTPWNANPRDIYGTPGPYEDAVQNTPIFEENGPDDFKGIDIMRTVRSFDPCLPCGVHMYLGGGRTLKTVHSPMFGVGRQAGFVSDNERPRLEEALHRIDSLASALDRVADASAREAARELLGLVLDLHGLALARSLAIIASAENGRELVDRLAKDEQVRAALLLHGLHPEPIEERVGKAIEGLQPQLGMHGCRVRLIKVGAEIVRLRLEGAHGPEGLRASGLRQQIEAAIIYAAPDLDDIVIEGLEDAGIERAALAAG